MTVRYRGVKLRYKGPSTGPRVSAKISEEIAEDATEEISKLIRRISDDIDASYKPLYESSNYRNGLRPYHSVFDQRDNLYRVFVPKVRVRSSSAKRSGDKMVIRITLGVRVEDGHGNPNNLWTWLSYGTKDSVQKYTSPRIPMPRGEYSVIVAGWTRKGIKARNYHEEIASWLKGWLAQYGDSWTVTVSGKTGTVRHKISERIGSHG